MLIQEKYLSPETPQRLFRLLCNWLVTSCNTISFVTVDLPDRTCLSRVPDREVGESQDERDASWRERRGPKREHVEERVDSTVKEGRFQGGEGGQARRAFLGEVEGSMSG